MSKKNKDNNLSYVIKVRITEQQKQAINKIMKEEKNKNTSISHILRRCMETSTLKEPSTIMESYQAKIQQYVMVNHIHNTLMANPDLPRKSKKIITEEFKNYV